MKEYNNLTLVDSHCHLDMKEFENDLDQVIARSKEFGVQYMQTICTRLSNFPKVLSIAKRYDNIFASVGVHPHDVDEEGIPAVEELVRLSSDSKVIAFGETGLDYYYEYSNKENQKTSFINHITASRLTNKPVIVHSRDADSDTIDILRSETQKGAFKGLIHCFSTGIELAEAAITLGMYVSISGIVTFKNSINLQEIIKNLPLNRLLVETDSPFLAPVPMRGKTNEPSYTYYVAEKIAQIKGIGIDEVAKVTTKNFFDLMRV